MHTMSTRSRTFLKNNTYVGNYSLIARIAPSMKQKQSRTVKLKPHIRYQSELPRKARRVAQHVTKSLGKAQEFGNS